MAGSAVDVALPRLGRCLRVENAPDVVDALARAMPGWPMTVRPAAGPTPGMYVYRDAEGLWQGSLDEPDEFDLPSPASAACSLVGELVSQRLDNAPTLLGLHCGSVEINGQLVLFPESSRAGKSTLSVAFAAAGYRVFGDDVLGLTLGGEGVAMGVAPRLRLPLPDSFSREFVEYAKRHAGPEDARYRFVIPAANRLARFDESSPVGAIVLLERDPQIPQPNVVRLSPGEGLLQLLCQNFARDTPDDTLLERLLALMRRVPCLLLRYSEPLAGARHLARVVEGSHFQRASDASLLNHPPASAKDASPRDLDSVWMPASGVSAYPLGEELFLIHTASGAIHRLNASGRVVWQLLQQEPLSGHALSDLLAACFDAPLAAVTADVGALMAALAQAGLVVEE
ncbi:MAG TPA: PqqD family protein [Halomonas sp.]|nr:PqqD family protein [Halomonas sp.]